MTKFGLLVVAIALCSCSQDEVDPVRPDIGLSAGLIAFGQVPITRYRLETLAVENTGVVDFDLEMRVAGRRSEGAFYITEGPSTLAQGERGHIQVMCRPAAIAELRDNLEIVLRSSDGERSVGVSLSCDGVENVPALAHESEVSLVLSPSAEGGPVQEDFVVTNEATFAVTIIEADVEVVQRPEGSASLQPFRLASEPDATTLGPGEAVSVKVIFEPDVVGDYQGTILLRTDDPVQDSYLVEIRGSVSDEA